MATDDIECRFLSGFCCVELSVLIPAGSYLNMDCIGKTKRQLLKEISTHFEEEITEDTALFVHNELLEIVWQRKVPSALEGRDEDSPASS